MSFVVCIWDSWKHQLRDLFFNELWKSWTENRPVDLHIEMRLWSEWRKNMHLFFFCGALNCAPYLRSSDLFFQCHEFHRKVSHQLVWNQGEPGTKGEPGTRYNTGMYVHIRYVDMYIYIYPYYSNRLLSTSKSSKGLESLILIWMTSFVYQQTFLLLHVAKNPSPPQVPGLPTFSSSTFFSSTFSTSGFTWTTGSTSSMGMVSVVAWTPRWVCINRRELKTKPNPPVTGSMKYAGSVSWW